MVINDSRGRENPPVHLRGPLGAVLGLTVMVSACGGALDGDSTPGWGRPEVLGRSQGYATLTGDGQGGAVAVWVPSVRAGEPLTHLAVRRFAPGTGWTPVETIDSPTGMSFQAPAAAMDAEGSIIVSWSGGDGLYAARFAEGRGWTAALRISPRSAGSLASPALKLDGVGNALAIWGQGSALWTTRFEPASGWNAPTRMPESGQVESRSDAPPALAVNAAGDALAVWTQGPQTARTLWASAFTPGSGWSPQERIGSSSSLHLYNPGAALNDRGEGLVLWSQQDPNVNGDDTVVATHFQPGMGFTPVEPLGNFGWLAAGLDASGNAIAFTIGPLALRVHRYTVRQGWAPSELLEGVGGYDSISTDANGNGWILWMNEGPGEIWSRRLQGGRSTDPLVPVAQPGSGTASQVRGVADARGGAVALWFETADSTVVDPEWTVMANRFLVR